LIVSPDELSEVVQALASQIEDFSKTLDDPPTPRLSYDKKNILNNMTEAYAKAQRKKYLKETLSVKTFLAAPENFDLLRRYEAAADEFQLKIIAWRRDYHTFDKVLEYLVDLLFNRDPILRRHKRLTRGLLFYMYWNCDIGEVDVAETD